MISVEELARAMFEGIGLTLSWSDATTPMRDGVTRSASEILRRIAANRPKAPPLVLDRPMVCIDVEATGKDPNVDRVVEFAAVTQWPDGTRSRYVQRINPGVPMSAEVTAIHGITDADVADCPMFDEAVSTIRGLLLHADRTGFNIRQYDDTILRAEFARCNVAFPEGAHVVDSFNVYRAHERRDIASAVRFYLHREHVGAHGALADAEAALDVMLAQVERYPDLPRDIAALDVASGGRQPDWATDDGKIRWDTGGDAVIAFGSKNMGLRLIDADNGLLYWILGRDFAKDVHALCSDVLAGQRPRAPGAVPAPAPARQRREFRRVANEEPSDEGSGDDSADDDWTESVASSNTEGHDPRRAEDDLPF